MKIFCPLAVAAIVMGAGCGEEFTEASGFSSLPNSGGDTSETFFPMTDSSGGSGTAPTTTAGTNSGGDEESTSETPGTSGSGTTSGTTSGGSTSGSSTGSGPDDTGGTGPVIGGCGNGSIDMNEQCDGQNLNGFTCESLGNTGGTLLCDAVTCTFDTSLCTNDMTGGTSG